MKKGWQRYHTIWTMLFLGWFVSYIDRTATGPIITWMIDNKVSFFSDVPNPHEFGGLIGSLFFAGFMLIQFPAGFLGDKFGYRPVIILCILWSGVATLLTGLTGGLVMFVLLRILLGLGEGVLYSNDRSYIVFNTPAEKVGLGMGVVITGLSVGLTAATIGTPLLLKLAQPVMGKESWRFPFFLLGVISLLVLLLMFKYMRPSPERINSAKPESPGIKEYYGRALIQLCLYSAVFLAIIMGIYFACTQLNFSGVAIAFILTALTPLLILYLYKTKKSDVHPVLMNRNLIFLYLSAIAIMWHLWFYGFWSVAIVKEFGGGALIGAALVASFNGIAGIIGFPLGGVISDRVAHKLNGRRNVLALLTGILTITIFGFAMYLQMGNRHLVVMSVILFVSGLFFFALQPVAHALTAEIAPEGKHGTAFGMWNLIAEIGAVLSPVVSGFLRDSTDSWGAPLYLDGALMGISCLLILAISAHSVPIPFRKKGALPIK
ncbi:MFS transporter [Fictibacillus enclensis]|uniref:MFS transporter n=1 Tax=Fictibacillus enclensis TaxID=1017270 RepID=UPI0025A01D2A|nr:MFS transporter [Fictibacillus enclensis]MDM5340269.1 MFS transporter [Fictibacillus enclensis]